MENWDPRVALPNTMFYGVKSIPACTKWLVVRNWDAATKIKTAYPNWDSNCAPGLELRDQRGEITYVGNDACLAEKTADAVEAATRGRCQVR